MIFSGIIKGKALDFVGVQGYLNNTPCRENRIDKQSKFKNRTKNKPNKIKKQKLKIKKRQLQKKFVAAFF